MWLYNTFDIIKPQEDVSDCIGCGNTQVLFSLTEILWEHKFLSDVTGCRKTQVSDCTSSTVYTVHRYITEFMITYRNLFKCM
jgi:hypothetical protein